MWAGLAPDRRRALPDAAKAMASPQLDWADAEAVLESARQAGHELIEPDPFLTEEIDQSVRDGIGDMAGFARRLPDRGSGGALRDLPRPPRQMERSDFGNAGPK